MKSTTSSEAFNSWHAKNKTGLHIRVPEEDKQYISSTAECRETSISDGFILIACDGIWDEMDNKEAADICGKLLVKTAMDKTANVADLFVAECLKKAAKRVSHGPSHTQTPPSNCLAPPIEKANALLGDWLTQPDVRFYCIGGRRV